MTSGKRVHSPDGNSGDRPAKRFSLATGDVSIGRRHFSTNSNRYSSEDWVQQAGGLTINTDVEMSMEPEVQSLPLQTPVPPQRQDIVIESQSPNALRRHYEGRDSERIQPVVPPTPISPIKEQPSTRPSTPPNSSPTTMVSSSPVISFSQIPPSLTKRRVFFGPRTGCDKCLLGVKGHFIHSE